MTPKVPDVLAEIAGLIGRSLVPGGDPAEVGANLGLSAALIGLAAQRFDGMAQALVEENRAVRAILAQGAELLGEGGWRALSATADEDFRISALERTNAELLLDGMGELLDEGLEPWKVRQVLVTGVERPNLWIDVSETLDTGMQALRCHVSQFDDWADVENRVRERIGEAGKRVGMPMAQAFLSIDLS